MKFGQAFVVILVSIILASGAAYYVSGASGTGAGRSVKETRLEQVKRTGVLRCGYIILPPFIAKDSNTGKMSGLVADIVEEMGRQLKLKIEWTAETSWGQMLTELNLNRYDIVAGAVFMNPNRAREADFTSPLLYSPAIMVVRKDDDRFDKDISRANKPDVKFVHIDGMYTALVSEEEFPLAVKTSLSQISNAAELFVMIATKKADASVVDSHAFALYAVNNPGVLRPVAGKPLRVTAMGLPLPANEPALKAMLDTTLAYLHDSGFIDKTLKKYDDPVKFIRVAKPYAE